MVRAEVVLVETVSQVRVARVEPGVQLGLEDVGMVENTDEAEMATRPRGRGRGGRCGLLMYFFARSNTTIRTHTSL